MTYTAKLERTLQPSAFLMGNKLLYIRWGGYDGLVNFQKGQFSHKRTRNADKMPLCASVFYLNGHFWCFPGTFLRLGSTPEASLDAFLGFGNAPKALPDAFLGFGNAPRPCPTCFRPLGMLPRLPLACFQTLGELPRLVLERFHALGALPKPRQHIFTLWESFRRRAVALSCLRCKPTACLRKTREGGRGKALSIQFEQKSS